MIGLRVTIVTLGVLVWFGNFYLIIEWLGHGIPTLGLLALSTVINVSFIWSNWQSLDELRRGGETQC